MEPDPGVPSPEPVGAVVVVMDPGVVLDVTAALVDVVTSEDDVVELLDVDDDVDAAVLSSLSSLRFPGLATASATPTTTSRTAAASRSRDRCSRGITSSSD